MEVGSGEVEVAKAQDRRDVEAAEQVPFISLNRLSMMRYSASYLGCLWAGMRVFHRDLVATRTERENNKLKLLIAR